MAFDSKEFEKKYNTLVKEGKYGELADYLSTIRMKDGQSQSQLNSQIALLRQQSRNMQAMMGSANSEQREAIRFSNMVNQGMAIPSQYIDSQTGEKVTNSYAKEYNKMLSALGNGADAYDMQGNPKDQRQIATGIQIKFEPKVIKRYGIFGIDWLAKDEVKEDSGYDLFRNQMGLSSDTATAKKQLKGMGIDLFTNEDGSATIKLNKNNSSIYKVIKALNGVNTNYSTVTGNNPINPNAIGTARYQIAGVNAENKLIKNKQRTETPVLDFFDQYNAWISDEEGFFSSTQRAHPDNDYYYNPTFVSESNPISEMNSIVRKAKSKVDELNPENNDEINPVNVKSTVASFQGAKEAQLNQLLATGQIKTEDYNVAMKALNNQYNSLIIGNPLTDLHIYGTDYGLKDDYSDFDEADKNKTLHEYTDTKDKSHVKDEILRAIAAESSTDSSYGTNIRYQAMMVGDKVGTLVTIMPHENKVDSKGNVVKAKESDRQYFIEGLFTDQAEKLFASDTKTQAAQEYNNMVAFRNRNEVPLGNGKTGTLEYVTNANGEDQWLLTTKMGNDIVDSQAINAERATTLLNQKFILENGVAKANMAYFNEDGTQKTNYDPNMDINKYAAEATAELYPQTYQSYVMKKQKGEDYSAEKQFLDNYSLLFGNYISGDIGYSFSLNSFFE